MASISLLAGALLTWTRPLGEFSATLMFAGNLRGRTQTLPLFIYVSLEQDIDMSIRVSIVLMTLTLFTLILARTFTRTLQSMDSS